MELELSTLSLATEKPTVETIYSYPLYSVFITKELMKTYNYGVKFAEIRKGWVDLKTSIYLLENALKFDKDIKEAVIGNTYRTPEDNREIIEIEEEIIKEMLFLSQKYNSTLDCILQHVIDIYHDNQLV